MHEYEYDYGNVHYVRVSKARAKKIFAAGYPLQAQACNLRPDGMMGVINVDYYRSAGIDFDTFESRATWYNCTNETGRYLAWYAPVLVLPRFYNCFSDRTYDVFYLSEAPDVETIELFESCGCWFGTSQSEYAPELKQTALIIPHKVRNTMHVRYF